MRSSRNNILAGLFVLLALGAGTSIALTLGQAGDWLHPKNAFLVRFSLADGANGLKNGSTVKVGGQVVGAVGDVRFERDAGTGVPTNVLVEILIAKDIPLYTNASVSLEMPLLGTVSTINIPSVGTPDKPALKPGDTIDGGLPPPGILTQAGFGEKQKTQLQAIIDRAYTFSEKINPISDEFAGALKNARELSQDARDGFSSWKPRVSATLENAQKASENLDAGITDARTLIKSAQETLDTNRPKIDASIANVQELTQKAKGEFYERALGVIDRARQTVDELYASGQRINSLIAEQSPEIRLTLANLRLSSDQLKLTMTEVRRNPWRLLYSPDRMELEKELTYDTARSYASAVSDLRAASASLESVTHAAAGGAGIEPGTIAAVKAQIEDSLKRYRAAEDRFLRKVLSDPEPGVP